MSAAQASAARAQQAERTRAENLVIVLSLVRRIQFYFIA
jgi:hypothetical protein